MPNPQVEIAGLTSELAALALISEAEPPVVTRVVFSEADLRARAYVKRLCSAAGLSIREDAVGNTFARWTGSEPDLPAVATGSHIDAIPNAGAYDGTVGVLGGLEAIRALQRAGFQPKATALILNLGRSDPTRDPEQEFKQLRRQPAYRAAIDAGAVEIWMPRLYAAKAIEDRRISFQQGVTGLMPDGRMGLGPFDRSRTHHWLAAMESAFKPISSWLP